MVTTGIAGSGHGLLPLTGENGGAGFAGHNDWRIPNINELQTLADYGTVAPAIDTAFNDMPDNLTGQSFYWSSMSSVATPSNAWTVNFFDGKVTAFVKRGNLYVRAVRGGSDSLFGDLIFDNL